MIWHLANKEFIHKHVQVVIGLAFFHYEYATQSRHVLLQKRQALPAPSRCLTHFSYIHPSWLVGCKIACGLTDEGALQPKLCW